MYLQGKVAWDFVITIFLYKFYQSNLFWGTWFLRFCNIDIFHKLVPKNELKQIVMDIQTQNPLQFEEHIWLHLTNLVFDWNFIKDFFT